MRMIIAIMTVTGMDSLDKNWAIDWQNSHTINVDWYDCSAAHSQPLNGNLKAYAAWWLWAKLAGWDSASGLGNPNEPVLENYILFQNYPNPFNPNTKLRWQTSLAGWQTLKVFDALGNEIATLVDEYRSAGEYDYDFNSTNYSSGIYFYRLQIGQEFSELKKMILLK